MSDTTEWAAQEFTDDETGYIGAALLAVFRNAAVPVKTTLRLTEDEPVIVLCAQIGETEEEGFVPFAILLNNERVAQLLNVPEGTERITEEEAPVE